MKIELKHLAPYLPYRLNCYGQGEVIEGTESDENPIPKLLTIIGLDANWVTVEGIRITVDESIMIEDCMPILRPLSDLTKEICHDNKNFTPIKSLQFSESEIIVTEYRSNLNEKANTITITYKLMGDVFTDFIVNRDTVENTDYKYVKLLLEWHFDIFGLIEQGLAIDINSLSK